MIEWPTSPKEGDQFDYLDPISGCDTVHWRYSNGAWQHVLQPWQKDRAE